MKRKFCITLLLCLLSFLFISCGEVLSVVTVNKNGEKVVNNYISIYDEKVIDESSSINSWREISFLNDDYIDMNDLLFNIVDKKENIVVLGDKSGAVEINFFEGGYKYEVYTLMDNISEAANSVSDSLDLTTDSIMESIDSISESVADSFEDIFDDFSDSISDSFNDLFDF